MTNLFFCVCVYNIHISTYLQDYTEVEKEMQDHRMPAEQWHPVPPSFEHVLNHFKCFAAALQSVVSKPLEARLKEGTSHSAPGLFLFISLCILQPLAVNVFSVGYWCSVVLSGRHTVSCTCKFQKHLGVPHFPNHAQCVYAYGLFFLNCSLI